VLIAIVGIDGVGKTTQVELLKMFLSSFYPVKLCKAVVTNKSLVDNIDCNKEVTREEIISVAAAFDMLISYNTQMNLGDDFIYIWDRYKCCHEAYFPDEHTQHKISYMILKKTKAPDITVCLTINPVVAVERIIKRGNAGQWDCVNFLSKVQENYLRLFSANENFYIIDCTDLSKNAVHKRIINIIAKYIDISYI